MCVRHIGFFFSPFLLFPPWECWDTLFKYKALVITAFSCSSRNWPFNRARKMWTLVIPKVYYCCFLEINNSISQEALERMLSLRYKTKPCLLLFCYMSTPQGYIRFWQVRPQVRVEYPLLVWGIKENAEGEATFPTVHWQSQGSTYIGIVSYSV